MTLKCQFFYRVRRYLYPFDVFIHSSVLQTLKTYLHFYYSLVIPLILLKTLLGPFLGVCYEYVLYMSIACRVASILKSGHLYLGQEN